MRDLSMHVLDIAQNSIKAGASLVTVSFARDAERGLTLLVQDDGCGMPPDFLARVTDPFTTTRTTRKVGLGLPMLKQSAVMTGGSFAIESVPGGGTTVRAHFRLEHIDCIPMGDICDTLLTLIALNPERPEFFFLASSPGGQASFDTRVVRAALGGVPFTEPDVLAWIKESIDEEFKPILEVA